MIYASMKTIKQLRMSVTTSCHGFSVTAFGHHATSWFSGKHKVGKNMQRLWKDFIRTSKSFRFSQGLSNRGNSREPSLCTRVQPKTFLWLVMRRTVNFGMRNNSEKSSTLKGCKCSCQTLEKRCPTQILCLFPSGIFCNRRKTLSFPERNKETQLNYTQGVVCAHQCSSLAH